MFVKRPTEFCWRTLSVCDIVFKYLIGIHFALFLFVTLSFPMTLYFLLCYLSYEHLL